MKFDAFISHKGKTTLFDIVHAGNEGFTRRGRTAAC
jgi:hypothetical protein